ncbi:uncharacterized protein LOC114729579 [Neltuma alba]|uniref:uncharacterized protein LOC114729579 n=1 Tax=Neltuma alba TaxID=207710 RepID=UPI0010A3FF51|nr:uncharacterized protein LOC114729579 [Prosopis alba]
MQGTSLKGELTDRLWGFNLGQNGDTRDFNEVSATLCNINNDAKRISFWASARSQAREQGKTHGRHGVNNINENSEFEDLTIKLSGELGLLSMGQINQRRISESHKLQNAGLGEAGNRDHKVRSGII